MIERLDRTEAITLFVEDVAAVSAFHHDVLGLEQADPAGHVREVAQLPPPS